MTVDLDCSAVRQALVDDMEDDLMPEMKARLERHLKSCSQCTAVYDGVRNVVKLLGTEGAIELPEGLGKRLYKRLLSQFD